MTFRSLDDKVRHAIVMAFAAFLVLVTGVHDALFGLLGYDLGRYLETLLLCLVAAAGWEAWQKATGGRNSLREMVLDTLASMAGVVVMVTFHWLMSIS